MLSSSTSLQTLWLQSSFFFSIVLQCSENNDNLIHDVTDLKHVSSLWGCIDQLSWSIWWKEARWCFLDQREGSPWNDIKKMPVEEKCVTKVGRTGRSPIPIDPGLEKLPNRLRRSSNHVPWLHMSEVEYIKIHHVPFRWPPGLSLTPTKWNISLRSPLGLGLETWSGRLPELKASLTTLEQFECDRLGVREAVFLYFKNMQYSFGMI